MSPLVALVGVAMIGGGIFMWRRGSAENKASVSWPSVPGVVKSSGVVDEWRGSGKNRRHVHQYQLAYTYDVDGKSHSGSSYSQMAKNWPVLTEKYRVGGPVPVFYNPQTPSHHDIREPLARSSDLNASNLAFFLIVLGIIALGWSFAL